jgi:hypothetical protein
MNGFRTLVLSVTSYALFATQSMAMHAQAVAPPSQGPSISISLALAKDHVPVGQTPKAVVTMRNISHQMKCFRTADSLYRVHVEGKNGGPPETELQRKRQGEVRPGKDSSSADSFAGCLNIAPGDFAYIVYDLDVFYDLSVPGAYTVYMDILDESKDKLGTGVWLRTNTAQFEMQAPAEVQAPAK